MLVRLQRERIVYGERRNPLKTLEADRYSESQGQSPPESVQGTLDSGIAGAYGTQ